MKEILSFPKLGLAFNLSRVAFSIGSFNIYWYGVIIAVGFILGFFYVSCVSKKFGLETSDIIDVIAYSFFGGIIGARAYYIIFNFDLYKKNILDVFKIWEGGIAIYGGIIGSFLVGIIFLKKRKIKILPVTDAIVGGLILGQAIGRWGNFVNIEAFGSNTDNIFGMTSVSIQSYLLKIAPKLLKQNIVIDPTGNVHPCFFYESVWCLLGFIIIALITFNSDYNNLKKSKKINLCPGILTLIYFIWYSCARFVIEGLRVDSLMLGNIRISQLLSLVILVACLILLVLIYIKKYLYKNNLEEGK